MTVDILRSTPDITAKKLATKLKVKISYAYVLLSKARAKMSSDLSEIAVRELFNQLGTISPISTAEELSPLNVQVGGEHYKTMMIQPVEFITANNLGFLEGCIVKRISRWRSKDGIKDLHKIKHEVDLLIALNHLDD